MFLFYFTISLNSPIFPFYGATFAHFSVMDLFQIYQKSKNVNVEQIVFRVQAEFPPGAD